MQTREEMRAAVSAALAKSAGIVKRRFGAADLDQLVSAREKLRLIATRQVLGLQSGFRLLSVRSALAKHDALIQQYQDVERKAGRVLS